MLLGEPGTAEESRRGFDFTTRHAANIGRCEFNVGQVEMKDADEKDKN